MTTETETARLPHDYADWLRSEFQALLRRARDQQGVDDNYSVFPALAAAVAEVLADAERPYAKAWIEALNGAEGRFRAEKQPGQGSTAGAHRQTA